MNFYPRRTGRKFYSNVRRRYSSTLSHLQTHQHSNELALHPPTTTTARSDSECWTVCLPPPTTTAGSDSACSTECSHNLQQQLLCQIQHVEQHICACFNNRNKKLSAVSFNMLKRVSIILQQQHLCGKAQHGQHFHFHLQLRHHFNMRTNVSAATYWSPTVGVRLNTETPIICNNYSEICKLHLAAYLPPHESSYFCGTRPVSVKVTGEDFK